MNSPMVITTLLVWRGLGFVKDSLIPQMSRSVFVTSELQSVKGFCYCVKTTEKI